MKYIGRGAFSEVLSAASWDGAAGKLVVWGRRLRSLKSDDLRAIRGRDVLYIDTIDLRSCGPASLRLRWLVTPYRIEKSMTYYLLRLLAKRVYRVHVPAIADSGVWRRLVADALGSSVSIRGFTYRGLVELLGKLAAEGALASRYRSRELYELAATHGAEVVEMRVRAEDFSSRLLRSVSCFA